jgi:hypothetical protein
MESFWILTIINKLYIYIIMSSIDKLPPVTATICHVEPARSGEMKLPECPTNKGEFPIALFADQGFVNTNRPRSRNHLLLGQMPDGTRKGFHNLNTAIFRLYEKAENRNDNFGNPLIGGTETKDGKGATSEQSFAFQASLPSPTDIRTFRIQFHKDGEILEGIEALQALMNRNSDVLADSSSRPENNFGLVNPFYTEVAGSGNIVSISTSDQQGYLGSSFISQTNIKDLESQQYTTSVAVKRPDSEKEDRIEFLNMQMGETAVYGFCEGNPKGKLIGVAPESGHLRAMIEKCENKKIPQILTINSGRAF